MEEQGFLKAPLKTLSLPDKLLLQSRIIKSSDDFSVNNKVDILL